MREIIERSKNIFKFGIITAILFLIFSIGGIYNGISILRETNVTSASGVNNGGLEYLGSKQLMIMGMVAIIGGILFILLIIEFIKGIKLFFTIRNKYDLLMYEEIGGGGGFWGGRRIGNTFKT